MNSAIACSAVRRGLRLELRYSDFGRLVEVHAVGVDRPGKEAMLVWQIRRSIDAGAKGWKILPLGDVGNAALTPQKSLAPRSGFEPQQHPIEAISCSV